MALANECCPTCKGKIKIIEPPDEIICAPVPKQEGPLKFVARRQKATCVNGHTFLVDQGHVGHHSTAIEAEMKTQFPKKTWPRMRRLMTDLEYKHFRRSVEGKRIPENDEIERWRKMQDSLAEER